MYGQKRVIDASKGWSNTNAAPSRMQQQVSVPKQSQQPRVVQDPRQQQQRIPYVPKQIVRQQPSYTVSVNPNANLIFQEPQPVPMRQQPAPAVHTQSIPESRQPTMQVQQAPVAQVEEHIDDTPVQKNIKGKIPDHDSDMKGFDMSGCKTIQEVYNKNAKRIKITPE